MDPPSGSSVLTSTFPSSMRYSLAGKPSPDSRRSRMLPNDMVSWLRDGCIRIGNMFETKRVLAGTERVNGRVAKTQRLGKVLGRAGDCRRSTDHREIRG